MLPMAVAPSCSGSGMLTIGRIAYRREGIFSPLTMHYNALAAKGSFANNVMQHTGSFRRCRVR